MAGHSSAAASQVRFVDQTQTIGLSLSTFAKSPDTFELGDLYIFGGWKRALENVRPYLGGSWIFWDELDEGIALDEWLPYTLGMEPAALLGKRNRGKKASPKKARAARKNGAKGGRPKKKAA